MGTTRRMIASVGQQMVQALSEEGADVRSIARVMAQMAMGYRDVIGDDRLQFVRATKKELTPKIVEVQDKVTGERREILLIDTRSQQKACEMILKVFGLIQSGFQLNVNTAPGGAAGAGAQGSYADKVLQVHAGDDDGAAVRKLVASLPSEVQRQLIRAIRIDQEAAAAKKKNRVEETG